MVDFKPKKNKVSITLDNDLIENVKLLSERDERSFSQYINIALKEYLRLKGHYEMEKH